MSIYPDRKNGTLTGRYRVEVQHAGSRARGRADSLKDAQQLEVDLKAQLASGTPKPKHLAKVVEAVVTMGIARDKAAGLLWSGQSTEDSSLRKLNRVVRMVGENTPINAFDNNTLDRLMVDLKTQGASDATVNRYLSNMSAFLKFCFKRGLRTEPVPQFDWRDEDEGRIRWITYEEEDALAELLPEPFATVVHIAIRTGMRAREILSLQPDQVSPRWVHLWGTGTKTGHSRSVPINSELYELLAPLVSTGSLPTYPQLRYEWDRAREAMNLKSDPTFVFHACRHTYATRAVQAGVNIRVIQKLMGHKSIQTTLRYAHVDDETLASAATSAISFHDDRRGTKGAVSQPDPASRGAFNRPKAKRSVSLEWTTNPRTPVRFRLGPPPNPPVLANDD